MWRTAFPWRVMDEIVVRVLRLTASKDLLMNLQMEMLLHSDPALKEETANSCV
jgi:hypothetical protein